MNIITIILTAICQLFIELFRPLVSRIRSIPKPATAGNSKARKKLVMIVAILVIAGSLTSIVLTMIPPSAPKINRRLYVGLGQALADETAKALNHRGRIVVVISPDFLMSGTPMYFEWQAFLGQLKKAGAIEIITTEKVPIAETSPDQNLPRKDFDNILGRSPRASAIVSLIGLPTLDPAKPLTLPATAPKIIAISNAMASSAKEYFSSSIATVLIIPRGPPTGKPAIPKTPREMFDRYYRVCTLVNYELLAN